MASYRFHKAARDGLLDILKEATRRDCNGRDEDGMTPTLWAAFEGKQAALRLLVGRGGDVDKADHFGNTALHFAAARGHMECVTFLANFGSNLWALDIDFHTAKELAAMNGRDEVLRFLDAAAAKEEFTNKKTVKAKKDKAKKDAEKRSKEYDELKKKADQMAIKEQKRLEQERMRRMTNGKENDENDESGVGIKGLLHRPSTVIHALRKGLNRKIVNQGENQGSESARFSTIVGSGGGPGTRRNNNPGGVQKKLIQRHKQLGTTNGLSNTDFKIGEIESDGKRSVRSLTGLRRDSEVIFVGTYDAGGPGQRKKISDVFPENSSENGTIDLETDPSDHGYGGIKGGGYCGDSGFSEEFMLQEPASMLERKGFGSIAFRNSITATLSALPRLNVDDNEDTINDDCSIGSAGSLVKHNRSLDTVLDNEDLYSDDENGGEVTTFLASIGLKEYGPIFEKARFEDMDSFAGITEAHLRDLNIPLGSSLKLLKALANRRHDLENPGVVRDSRL